LSVLYYSYYRNYYKSQYGKVEANKVALFLHKVKDSGVRDLELFRLPRAFYPQMNKSEKERYSRNRAKIDKLITMLKNTQHDSPQQMLIALAVIYLKES